LFYFFFDQENVGETKQILPLHLNSILFHSLNNESLSSTDINLDEKSIRLLFTILEQAEVKGFEEISMKLFMFFFTLCLDEVCDIPWSQKDYKKMKERRKRNKKIKEMQKKNKEALKSNDLKNEVQEEDISENEISYKFRPSASFLSFTSIDLIFDRLKTLCSNIKSLPFAYESGDYLLFHIGIVFFFFYDHIKIFMFSM
jgi:hypothetical protein